MGHKRAKKSFFRCKYETFMGFRWLVWYKFNFNLWHRDVLGDFWNSGLLPFLQKLLVSVQFKLKGLPCNFSRLKHFIIINWRGWMRRQCGAYFTTFGGRIYPIREKSVPKVYPRVQEKCSDCIKYERLLMLHKSEFSEGHGCGKENIERKFHCYKSPRRDSTICGECVYFAFHIIPHLLDGINFPSWRGVSHFGGDTNV